MRAAKRAALGSFNSAKICLVTGQIALAVVLLGGRGAFYAKACFRLLNTNLGFERTILLTARLKLPVETGYGGPTGPARCLSSVKASYSGI